MSIQRNYKQPQLHMAAFICIPHVEWLYYKQQQNKCHETLHVVLIIIYTNTDMKYLKLDTRQP